MEKSSSSVFGDIDKMMEAQMRSGDITLPASIVDSLEENGVESCELNRIIGPKDEICRLVAQKENLSSEMAERVSRLAHIISLAETVFGTSPKAFVWLRCPNPHFNGKAPIDLLDRETGARIVDEALMQIEYGVFA